MNFDLPRPDSLGSANSRTPRIAVMSTKTGCWPPNRRANQAWSDAKLCASSRRNGHFHKPVSWPSRRSAYRTDLGPFRRPSDRTWPVWLEVKSEENARTIRQKGLRPPAGTPRQQKCVFDWQGQQQLASGLKKTNTIRGSRRPSQGLQVALLQLYLAHLT